MTEFLIANMAPLMFASLVVFLLCGFPVAFSLAANGILFGLIGIELGLLHGALFQALPERIFGIMANDTLLAVPFFTFMGLILERSGMAEDLLDTIGQLFGPVRGGLAFAVVFVGALLAATTGVVAASVISMGLISLPIMLRYGYDHRLATGVIAASGTLAQIVPPSLVLIVMADQLGRSVGDMYQGALLPGLILTGMYLGYVGLVAIFRPALAPAMPLEARTLREDSGASGLRSLAWLFAIAVAGAWLFANRVYSADAPRDELVVVSSMVGIGIAFVIAILNRMLGLGLLSRMAERITFVLIPPLGLIFLVLGTIFIGVATPTEGGAMGASGALLMALLRARLSLPLLKQAMDSTTKLSCFVIFILIGSSVFSLTFRGVDGDLWVEHLMTSLPGGADGLPDRGEHPCVHPCLLPRLLRACLHHRPLAGAGCGQARHRSDLVRCAAGGQHADLLPASAVRVRLVLPALGRVGEGEDCLDLLGGRAFRHHPAACGGADHHVSGLGLA